MAIESINIENIRVIHTAFISLNSKFNLFIGENASGKTSILEACSILATGKSFRTSYFDELVQHNTEFARIVASVNNNITEKTKTIGIERKKNKQTLIHINQQANKKQAELCNHVVAQVITPKAADLIESGASIRRRFMDWGLFHVEHDSKEILKAFNKALKQRNALLKNTKTTPEELSVWNEQFVKAGVALTTKREEYIQKVAIKFNEKYKKWLEIEDLEVSFNQGWTQQKTLAKALEDSFSNDKKYKVTNLGPQRANFSLLTEGHLAKQILSRGQLKLLSFLLRLSQIDLFCQETNKNPILLIDDMSAELDEQNKAIVLNCLDKLNVQVLLTATSDNQLNLKGKNTSMFHVKHGEIKEQTIK